jgi:hypothetical protein
MDIIVPRDSRVAARNRALLAALEAYGAKPEIIEL